MVQIVKSIAAFYCKRRVKKIKNIYSDRGGGRNRRHKRSLLLRSDGTVLFKHDGFGVDAHTLGGVVGFVDADETIGDLEHVVPQGDDDELSVLCLLLYKGKKEKNCYLRR